MSPSPGSTAQREADGDRLRTKPRPQLVGLGVFFNPPLGGIPPGSISIWSRGAGPSLGPWQLLQPLDHCARI